MAATRLGIELQEGVAITCYCGEYEAVEIEMTLTIKDIRGKILRHCKESRFTKTKERLRFIATLEDLTGNY